jgi:Flp pilus assembly protein TadG
MRVPVNRKGAAAVEFALVAPLLCIVILGSLEIGRALQVQMALTNAAREGCRAYCDTTATVTLDGTTYQTGTSNYAIAVVKYSLKNANVGITSSNIGRVTITATTGTATTVSGVTLTPATVTATVPYSSVAWSPSFIIGSSNLTASITMRKP